MCRRFDSCLSDSNELQSLESFSLTSCGSSVSRWEIHAVQVGTLDFFKKRCLWKKNVVRIAENMMISHGFVLMVIANIVQTLRNQRTVANVGRALKMTAQEMNKMQEDLSDYKKVFSDLEKRCSQEALEYWHRHLWHGLTIRSNKEVTFPKDGEPPKEPLKLADWLIDRGLKDGIRLYSKNDLKKLANYLLIYCGDEND